jgi:hypothetical protein
VVIGVKPWQRHTVFVDVEIWMRSMKSWGRQKKSLCFSTPPKSEDGLWCVIGSESMTRNEMHETHYLF